MARFIVMTSINAPTDSVRRFAEFQDYQMVVVADRKTPTDWQWEGVRFISVQDQLESAYQLAKTLPFNHYSRKNLGYLHAIEAGAEAIVDTDDDNLPKENWAFPSLEGIFPTTSADLGFVNVYRSFTEQHIWPRGFPLDMVKMDSTVLCEKDLSEEQARIGVWQGLADGDPDVDAIYRLVLDEPCVFRERKPLVLAKGTVCPMNSQNTLFSRDLFPLLYLPSTVSMRFTDILRGFVVQPIMWLYGYRLGFLGATVSQERNYHDYLDDFRMEVSCYLKTYDVWDSVGAAISSRESLTDNLWNAYEALGKVEVVQREELDLLSCWLRDLQLISRHDDNGGRCT